jgi:hypothetical protein
MNSKSTIIVILAHYNDNERLKKTIQSVDEPFPVDLLIIDDGSTIKPNLSELELLYGDRGILKIEFLDKNQGVGKVRNIGLQLIKSLNYKYVGVMDSDDLNKKYRFLKQISHLEENPDVKLIGAWSECVDENGRFLFIQKHPISYDKIKKHMYINSMFIHASVVFRKEIINSVGDYPEEYKKGGVEDYAFLFKVIKKFKAVNIPEPLIYYTINSKGLSSKQRHWQVYNRIRVIYSNFYFGFYPIYGLLRNIPLLVFPRNLLTTVKKLLS